jgi:hypothetical protein
MTAPFDPIQTAFDSSVREFKNRMADDKIYIEIPRTKTIDEVYAATDRLQAEQAKNGHLRHLSKLGPYLTRLKDYAHTVEVFVQAKAEVLAMMGTDCSAAPVRKRAKDVL